jgi:hypothetical protein
MPGTTSTIGCSLCEFWKKMRICKRECEWITKKTLVRVRPKGPLSVIGTTKLYVTSPPTGLALPLTLVGIYLIFIAAASDVALNNGWPQTASALITLPERLRIMATVTAPEAPAAFAMSGYAGLGIEVACPPRRAPVITLSKASAIVPGAVSFSKYPISSGTSETSTG